MGGGVLLRFPQQAQRSRSAFGEAYRYAPIARWTSSQGMRLASKSAATAASCAKTQKKVVVSLLASFHVDRQPVTFKQQQCHNQPQSHTTRPALNKKLTMSTGKRKFTDFDSEANGQGRDRSRGHVAGGPSSKKSKMHKAKPDNMPWVKKRARTIERLLRTSQDLPANVQNDLERELEHHRSRIAKAADDKQRKDMISKYHMVRFFGECTIGCEIETAGLMADVSC